MLGKQAKLLTDAQIKSILCSLNSGRNALRNKVIFHLSLHGLRAKEVSSLELSMITDAEGNLADAIALEDKASKGHSGRIIYMNAALKEALSQYLPSRKNKMSKFVICTERRERFTANGIAVLFYNLYRGLGFQGLSSHSGRRTFATRAARKVAQVGGSLRDVQAILGHRHLSTTQKYLEQDVDAQRKVVSAIY